MKNKNEILSILNEYDIDKNEFIILSGAAMVIKGVKDITNDIDIAVSNKLYDELLNKYNCFFEKEVLGYKVWFIDDINFSEHYYDDLEYDYFLGYKVQTLESILKLKRELNRDKDKDDIDKILKFIK